MKGADSLNQLARLVGTRDKVASTGETNGNQSKRICQEGKSPRSGFGQLISAYRDAHAPKLKNRTMAISETGLVPKAKVK